MKALNAANHPIYCEIPF